MKRLTAVLLAGILLAGRPVASAEFQPSDYYTSVFTILGSAGGAVLGASIAGMSRPISGSAVTPFMQWGAVGAIAGGALGRDIAQFSLENETDIPGPKPVSTKEANACLGALGGQLAGYAIIAVANDPVSRNDRNLWAGIALGTLVGSAIGYLLPPIPLITLPPDQSKKERMHELRSTTLEPLIPVGPDARGYMKGVETVPSASLPQSQPFLPASKLAKLDSMLMSPENDRMAGSYRPVFPENGPSTAKPVVSPYGSTRAGSAPATHLAAVAGFCMGAAGGASMGGSRSVMLTRLGVGGAAGLLGGWLMANSVLSPARASADEELEDMGHFLSISSAWTIAGTMVGIGTGAVLRNNYDKFRITDAARVTLGGAWLGMVGGAFSTSF